MEKTFDEVKKETAGVLESHGVGVKDVIACAYSDLLTSGKYGESCVVVTNDSVVTVTKQECARYYFKEIKNAKTEGYVSTGALCLEFDCGDFSISTYTNALSRKFGHLAELINKVREGEKLTEQDFISDTGITCCSKCGRRFDDQWRKVCPKCMNKVSLFLRVLSYAPRYKGKIAFIFICVAITTALQLFRPYLMGSVLFDSVLTQGGEFYGMIWQFVGVILALEIVSIALNIFQWRTGAAVAGNIIFTIKTEVFSAMQKLSLSFYSSKATGSLMTRVNDDALNIQYFLNEGMVYFVINAITVVSVGIIMFTFNPLLAALVYIPVPLIVFIVYKKVPEFWRLRWFSWVRRSKLNSLVNDTLTGMRVVKAFGKENTEIDRFGVANTGVFSTALNEGLAGVKTFPVLSYIMSIGGLFVWFIGGFQVIGQDISFGLFWTFIGYVMLIYQPVEFMMYSFNWWTDCMNSAQRVFEIIDRDPEVKEPERPTRATDLKGNIKFQNVTFAYEPNKPVLSDVNLTIKEGEMIGIVGQSGAGKSTIINLLTRLYDVSEGSILIDGVDIRNLSLDDLRKQIGYVLQETFLFSGTVAENIAYAKPDATMEEIISAAKLANAHDFIMQLPDGYQTVLGNRKRHNFSGGEKQRISIARAILINPRILILDEATAAVDTETERQIQESMEILTKGRTTIAIAHRLSTLRDADRIIAVDKGKIVEQGTHAELEALGGVFYEMLQRQKDALKMRGIDESDLAAVESQ